MIRSVAGWKSRVAKSTQFVANHQDASRLSRFDAAWLLGEATQTQRT
jgi:hypothetical protein